MSGGRKRWSVSDLDRLVQWRAEGASVRLIAERLGRSENAVRAAAQRRRLLLSGPNAVRRCLCCRKLFQPESRTNWICPRCKASEEWRSGGDYWCRIGQD